MFTVKHVDSRTANWRTLAAKEVTCDVAMNIVTAHRSDKPEEDVMFSFGHIYVMNDAGKTVSVYNLDNKQEQKHGNEAAEEVTVSRRVSVGK